MAKGKLLVNQDIECNKIVVPNSNNSVPHEVSKVIMDGQEVFDRAFWAIKDGIVVNGTLGVANIVNYSTVDVSTPYGTKKVLKLRFADSGSSTSTYLLSAITVHNSSLFENGLYNEPYVWMLQCKSQVKRVRGRLRGYRVYSSAINTQEMEDGFITYTPDDNWTPIKQDTDSALGYFPVSTSGLNSSFALSLNVGDFAYATIYIMNLAFMPLSLFENYKKILTT